MTNSTDLSQLPLTELIATLTAGHASAVELAQAVITRVGQLERLGAIAAFDPQWLLENAAQSDARRHAGNARALEGIPLLLKDNIDTDHLPTTGGTGALVGSVAPRNAPAAQRLSDAGVLLAAKAVMHELAYGITSNNTVTGPARNPYKPAMIAGGSSGGSASAVASYQFPAALGTDTGGSVRIPAALCGVFGFRPTVGRYPGQGVLPISHTRDTIGPIARTMDDIALLDQIMTGTPVTLATTHDRQCGSLRIGVPRAFGWQNLQRGVQELAEQALRTMTTAGVTLVEIDMTDVASRCESFNGPLTVYEMMHDLPSYLKERGVDITMSELIDGIGSPDVKAIVSGMLGQGAVSPESYLLARDIQRPAAQARYADLFNEHRIDAIAFPTTPITARRVGDDDFVELNGARVPTFETYVRHTALGSILGVPGLSLPIGMVDGLPVGLELDGLAMRDDELLAASHAVSQQFAPMPEPKR